MAKTEHQGLQIALILFVMVTIVLAITTFFFYQSADREYKKFADAEAKQKAAETRANESDDRLELVLHISGLEKRPEAEVNQLKQRLGGDAKMKGVLETFGRQMATYGASLPPEERTYGDLLPKILTNTRQLNMNNVSQVAAATKAIAERDAVQQAETARTGEALQSQKKAEEKLESETSKYLADRAKMQSDQEGAFKNLRATVKQREDQLATAATMAQDFQKKEAQLTSTIEGQKQALEAIRDEPFEVADGRVVTVNQGAKTVWINLGLADGLRRQTMFSVYDQGVTGVNADRKASIEVTSVIDQHLSEARIAYDDPANPILPGDQVFSPAWRPGRRIRFALAGFLDADGDGRSDRNLLRALISASGGQIDYEVHDDGTVEGEIKAGIRYLILGDSGADQPVEVVNRNLLSAYSEARAQATQLGVEIISIDQFLSWAGYRPEVRTRVVGLGEHADSSQFLPRDKDGKSRTSTSPVPEQFRRPPRKK